jgi:hypothetical protein
MDFLKLLFRVVCWSALFAGVAMIIAAFVR